MAYFSEEHGMHYRYRLEMTLKDAAAAGKVVCTVMQSPNYAGKDVANKSLQFLEKVDFTKGLPEPAH